MIVKIRRLVISKIRHLSLARLCILFCILIFLFTSYIYGLVEVSSHQVVINILPSNEIQVDNDYFLEDEEKHIFPKSAKSYQSKYDHLNDKKIKSFFIRVNENQEIIERLLTDDESKKATNIKNSYLSLINERHEKLKREMEKELELIKKEEEKNKNNKNEVNQENDDDDNEDDDETKIDPKDLKIKTTLNDDESVSRDDIVSFLKLEKVNRKNKHVKNVEELIKEFNIHNKNDQYELK